MHILLATRKKEPSRSSKDKRRKLTYPKIECYNCHKMGHYKNQCLENPRNNKRDREQANITDEAPPKKNKVKELEVKELYY